MESVHGVDVSWLHRPQKDAAGRPRAPSSPAAPLKQSIPPSNPPSKLPATSKLNGDKESLKPLSRVNTAPLPSPSPATSPAPVPETTENTTSRKPTLTRTGSEKGNSDGTRPGRRASWISNISSRFSSTSSPLPSPASPQLSRPLVNGSHVTSPQSDLEKHAAPQLSPSLSRGQADDLSPYVPQRPKESGSSFFSSITKRLAPGAQSGVGNKIENGGVCARRVLNVNPNRARCLLPELDQSKLRRVSFSVDVEIASGPKYRDDEPAADKSKKLKDKKIKERAEGEALKHPKAATDLKEEANDKDTPVDEALTKVDTNGSPEDDNRPDDKDHKSMTRKQEKKKRSEEERKERKEKKRKKAEENGTLPVELRNDDDSNNSSRSASIDAPPPAPKPSDRPTTDPVRIYRRCCQLRESPILKRITEQLTAPGCTDPGDSGIVTCLNLTGSRLQLADFITLGDWLAIVPVRRLLLEDAEITDEGLRVVLGGLLASKKPEPTRAQHRRGQPMPERAGVIERLTLKNNPRITKIGWKHLALFLNMCRSIKTVDLSMIPFPDTLPTGKILKGAPQPAQPPITDAAEIFAKALAERVGGDKLEELIMSECGLNSAQIRRILDAFVMAGIRRVGFAGSQLDKEAFESVLEYVRSGVCEALDIGSNHFNKEQMTQLAQALTHKADLPIWGLSLAACNLDVASLKALFPALIKMPLLRFLDFSHNRHLFENDNQEGVHLFRKYIPLLENLKRIHLMDVGISAKQTIGIAEVLPEGPTLAHIGLLENTELSKLVANTDEASQEEACALYASLMTAVRVSRSIICIEIDVPAPDNSEVVKALAKQVIAYCLRNMELMPLSAIVPNAPPDAGRPQTKEGGFSVTYPDVLLHLVGHVDEMSENHDNDDPAPDDDYIVGGTGVVKALQYCLGEAKAQEERRGSGPIPTPTSRSGATTPKSRDPDQEAGLEIERRGKAKEMSKSLLGSARKIRARLQPALIKESRDGDEMAYRRLNYLDQTLQGLIQRFEVEYPECRVPASSRTGASLGAKGIPESMATLASSFGALSADLGASGSDEDDEARISARPSRRGSEVSLAARAQTQEEGRMHRFGHELRQEVLKVESRNGSPKVGAASPSAAEAGVKWDDARLAELRERLDQLSGGELRSLVDEEGSMEHVLGKFGGTIADLRMLQENDPQGWQDFVQSQLAARKNKEMGGEQRT